MKTALEVGYRKMGAISLSREVPVGAKEQKTGKDGSSIENLSQRLSWISIAHAAACACIAGLAGGLAGYFWGKNMLLVPVMSGAGLVAVAAAQALYGRTVRKTFGSLLAAKSHVLKAVDAGDLCLESIDDAEDIGRLTLVQLIDKLTDAAQAANGSSAEFEFANKALLRDRRRMVSALDSVGTGVLAVGPSGQIVFANRALQPFLSISTKDATGKPVEECVTDQRLMTLLSESDGNSGGAAERIEISVGEDPSKRVFSVAANAVADDDEGIVGRCIQFEDVTGVKRAERAREQFVDNVAHEMRTPLTSMKAYVEMLIDGDAADPEAKYEFYNIIYEETDRLNRLIDNLLNISRMEVGGLTLNRTPTRLKKLIEDGVGVVESQIEKKGMNLTVDLPDRLPAVEVDKDLLAVVFVNLLGNAVKYTPEKGQVSVSSTSMSDEILVHITDTGVGIEESDQARVFDKFYRCQDATDSEVTGSGLGLCIARQIMRLHGGDIRLSSVPGEGSQFSVVIPRAAVVTSLGDYEHE